MFENENNINMWPGDMSCNIFMKTVVVFCLCLKSLPRTKVKRFTLILLAEEIFKQISIDLVRPILKVTVMIYNEMGKTEQGKI